MTGADTQPAQPPADSTTVTRPLGQTGLDVSALGYGGAPIGFSGVAEREAVRVVRQALDLGVAFVDTAPDYRTSERVLGRALAGRRDGVTIATKVGRIQDRTSAGTWEVREDWTEAGVVATVERSLRHLGVEHLDLVQLHSPPLDVLERGEALAGLVRAREAGTVGHVGVSADGAEAWWAVRSGAFATLQVSYSVLQQGPAADGLLDAAADAGMGIIAKQPVANGIADLDERPGHPDWSWKWDAAQRMDLSALGPPGHRTTGALRWVLADPRVSTAIVGTTSPEHLAANAAAAGAPLDPAAAADLARQFRLATT